MYNILYVDLGSTMTSMDISAKKNTKNSLTPVFSKTLSVFGCSNHSLLKSCLDLTLVNFLFLTYELVQLLDSFVNVLHNIWMFLQYHCSLTLSNIKSSESFAISLGEWFAIPALYFWLLHTHRQLETIYGVWHGMLRRKLLLGRAMKVERNGVPPVYQCSVP